MVYEIGGSSSYTAKFETKLLFTLETNREYQLL